MVIAAGVWAWLYALGVEGRREWAEVASELTSKGEMLTAQGRTTRAAADDQNFFADPLWKELMPGSPVAKEQWQIAALSAPVDMAALQTNFSDVVLPEDAKDFAELYRKMVALNSEESGVPSAAGSQKAARAFLAAIQPVEGILNRIQELSWRPMAVFPIRYEEGLRMQMPYLSPVLPIGKIFSARAQARATIGDTSGAVADTRTLLRLGTLFGQEPLLMSQLVASTMESLAAETARHCLPESSALQAQELQKAFLSVNRIVALHDSLRNERAVFNDTITKQRWSLRDFFDSVGMETISDSRSIYLSVLFWPWLRNNQASYNRYMQAWIEALAAGDRLGPRDAIAAARVLPPNFENKDLQKKYIFLKLILNSTHRVFKIISQRQSEVNQAVIACAIQRYFLNNRALPSDLRALQPEFLLELPRDVITAEDFHYVRESETTYKLWSPGWNEVDDGGLMPAKRSDLESADWVWQGRVR